MIYDMIYDIYLTAIGLTPDVNNTISHNTYNGTYITIKILKLTKEHIT
jgi:hypothetical protein